MPDRLLTDEELLKAYHDGWNIGKGTEVNAVRAVERAVLEKVEKPHLGPCVTERDSRYPAIPPEPKVVVGPSGTKYRMRNEKLEVSSGSVFWVHYSTIPVIDAATVADLMREGK